MQIGVFSWDYEGRLANFHQRLSQKRESKDVAVPVSVSVSAVVGADEGGGVAGWSRCRG
jgi:hypothetical protein